MGSVNTSIALSAKTGLPGVIEPGRPESTKRWRQACHTVTAIRQCPQ